MHPDACMSLIAAKKFFAHYSNWAELVFPAVCLIFVLLNIAFLATHRGSFKGLILINLTYIVILVGAFVKGLMLFVSMSRKWRLIRIFGDFLMPMMIVVVALRHLVEVHQVRFLRKLVKLGFLIPTIIVLSACFTYMPEHDIEHFNVTKIHDHFDCIIGQYQGIYAVHAMLLAVFLTSLAHCQATSFPISAEAIKLSRWYFFISLETGILLILSNALTIAYFRVSIKPGFVYIVQKWELFNTAFQFFITCGMDARLERLIIKVVTFGKCGGEEKDDSDTDLVIRRIRAMKKNKVAPKPNLIYYTQTLNVRKKTCFKATISLND
uniref:G_PROTEIN_RECEP_F1_2 domain-containing protein n=1 Tax=Panagrellus redivivus TaxID=6233 RepID=A0A7E4V5C4_PANRE